MSGARDNQRQRIYNSERDAFETKFPCDELHGLSVEECQEYIDKIVNSRWWKGRYNLRMSPRIKSGKGARHATARRGEHSIVLPLWARKKWVMLHELAHYACHYTPQSFRKSLAPHGPEFAKEYLALIQRWVGKEEADALRTSYKKNRVKYRVG